ncbi:unnamed protein product [Prorocentrum cordatum]|uniref:Uncharacterized protein n=1 Tax=Prorocentrum cordatum TaxID=2364126 RepID=A0ABN9VN35_9DINO|nr:unnamed protein product [Polarella glacialis]
MERVDALGGAMASTARAAEVLSSGLERLAGIFHCTGAKLQEVLPDFLLSSELDEDAAGVAELLLAWREVGEVGVVFATRMLGLSADLRKAALQVDYERSQRLAEVARLRQSLADVSAAAAEREAELGAAARRGTWRLLGWLSRGPGTAARHRGGAGGGGEGGAAEDRRAPGDHRRLPGAHRPADGGRAPQGERGALQRRPGGSPARQARR